MRVQKVEGSKEREILAALIFDEKTLTRVSSKWHKEIFSSPLGNLISGWCVKYFQKYHTVPRVRGINGMYRTWQEKSHNEDLAEQAGQLLAYVASEYKDSQFNSDYTIDLAGKHFREVAADALSEKIRGYLTVGDIDKAEAAIAAHKRVELGIDAGLDIFIDPTVWQGVYSADETADDLIPYPGALGIFFQGCFEREGFVAFMGSAKTGKTWWLIDAGWRAMCNRKKVAFFEVGDMTQRHILRRFGCRAAAHPYKNKTKVWPYTFRVPVGLGPPKGVGDSADVEFEERTFNATLSDDQAWTAIQKVQHDRVKSRNSYFKLRCFPNRTASVDTLEEALKDWEDKEGWVADVVVVDYADILAPLPEFKYAKDQREVINGSWMRLRTLSQERRCLVVTATQANREGFGKKIMDRRYVSEDRRKVDHVTAMCTINVNKADQDVGVFRMSLSAIREGESNYEQVVYVASCLPLAHPTMYSTF